MTIPTVTDAQAAQTGLVAAVGVQVARAVTQIDTRALPASLPQFTTLMAALIHRYGAAAATLAVRQYTLTRRGAGITEPFRPHPAPPAATQRIGKSIDWATKPLWSETPDIETTRTNVVGTVERLILDQARNTIVDNVHRDPHARGWARLTEPTPCYFCALLATRGAVYRTEKRAAFEAHDHCRCHAEPVFTAYEPPARVREWQALYRDTTTSGNAARTRREWRRAFDQQYGTPTA